MLGGSKLNEFIFQYADFANDIAGAHRRAAADVPERRDHRLQHQHAADDQQHKFQFRDDFSWHVTGMGGLGHDFKAGVNYIHEPQLFVTFSSGSADYAYTHLTNDLNGPISAITRNKPGASANLPMDQYGVYIQDDWRVTDRLTVNAGLRYDLVTGFPIDQSQIPNFVALTAAAAAGRFNGVPGLRGVRQEGPGGQEQHPAAHRRGARPPRRRQGRRPRRLGHLLRLRLHQREHPVPGAERARAGRASIFTVNNTAGIKNPDGSFFSVGQPIANIARQNEVQPGRAVLQHERRRAADPAALDEPDLGRLVAPVHADDGRRRRLRALDGRTSASAGR